jgi:hypothetical protein
MASKLNSEFNYRYQIMGETIWEKIKHLQNFLEGRIRATVLEEVSALKYQAKIAELELLRNNQAQPHLILQLRAEILEIESFFPAQKASFELNREEVKMLERLLVEAYEIAEPSRIAGYTDEQMFEANAVNEFTTVIRNEIEAEIIATGHPSPAKIRNAMSNPYTWIKLQDDGLIPKDIQYPNSLPLHSTKLLELAK